MPSDEPLGAVGAAKNWLRHACCCASLKPSGFGTSKTSEPQFSSGENATVASISSRKLTTNLYSLCHWEITSRAKPIGPSLHRTTLFPSCKSDPGGYHLYAKHWVWQLHVFLLFSGLSHLLHRIWQLHVFPGRLVTSAIIHTFQVFPIFSGFY